MFDWQTDEDPDSDAWAFPTTKQHTISIFQLIRNDWCLFLTFSVLIGFLIGLLVWQLQIQVNKTASQLRADVLQTHETLWQTAVSNDTDLFPLFLSPHNRQWQLLQRYLLTQNLIVHRAPMGLWLDETNHADPATHKAYLSDDFQMAEVQSIQSYVTQQLDGTLTDIFLKQTAVYTQNNNRWQLASPQQMEGFWGKLVINNAGKNITIIYPNRDKVIGRQLLTDFDEFVHDFCREPAINCPQNFHLRIYLSPEDDSLLLLTETDMKAVHIRKYVAAENQYIYEIELPTPTLLGIPQDDTSFEALFRGYAAWIGLGMLNDLATSPLDYNFMVSILADFNLQPPAAPAFNPNPNPPPIPLPEESLLVLCRESQKTTQLLKYSFTTNHWLAVEDDAAFNQFFEFLAEYAQLEQQSISMQTEQDLLTTVSTNKRPNSLNFIYTIPADNKMFFVATAEENSVPYLFEKKTRESEFSFLDRLPVSGVLSHFELRENGRFLTLAFQNNERSRSTLIVYDLEKHKFESYSMEGTYKNRVGWSKNNNWVFVLNERMMTLAAPEVGYESVIYHNFYGCDAAIWAPINP